MACDVSFAAAHIDCWMPRHTEEILAQPCCKHLSTIMPAEMMSLAVRLETPTFTRELVLNLAPPLAYTVDALATYVMRKEGVDVDALSLGLPKSMAPLYLERTYMMDPNICSGPEHMVLYEATQARLRCAAEGGEKPREALQPRLIWEKQGCDPSGTPVELFATCQQLQRLNHTPVIPLVITASDKGPRLGVRIRTLTGKTILIDTFSGTTVKQLKVAIDLREGIPPDQQRLIAQGKQLEDGGTLASYGIMNDSTVHLVLRLRGGMFHASSGRDGFDELGAVLPRYPITVHLGNGEVIQQDTYIWQKVDTFKRKLWEALVDRAQAGVQQRLQAEEEQQEEQEEAEEEEEEEGEGAEEQVVATRQVAKRGGRAGVRSGAAPAAGPAAGGTAAASDSCNHRVTRSQTKRQAEQQQEQAKAPSKRQRG